MAVTRKAWKIIYLIPRGIDLNKHEIAQTFFKSLFILLNIIWESTFIFLLINIIISISPSDDYIHMAWKHKIVSTKGQMFRGAVNNYVFMDYDFTSAIIGK